MMDALRGELEAMYEEIVDVLSRRLESVWDVLRDVQKESEALREKIEAVKAAVGDLRQAIVLSPLDDGERARFEAHLEKMENLLA
jgi:predicted  nucleic acid-binding Zn-ribbon protein